MSTDPYHASALSWQVVALTNQLERERDELRAEVELRLGQIDGWKERLRASEAENERLQFEVTDWQERNERLSVEAGRLSVEVDGLRALLQRLYEWDHMDGAGDGPYWRDEIDKALGRHKE